MSEGIAILIRVFVVIGDGIMSIFGFLHDAERWGTQTSRVGESEWDKEARSWAQRILAYWQIIFWVLLVIAALLGGGTWLLR